MPLTSPFAFGCNAARLHLHHHHLFGRLTAAEQASDIVITAAIRRSVPCTGMETVSQLVVSSVVAGMCVEGYTGTSCTTASNPTDSDGHCTFAVIECCQHRGIPPRPQPSLHAAGFKQLTAVDAVCSWTTTPFGSKGVATVFLVGTHVLANVAQERFLDYDNDSAIPHAARPVGVFVCKNMFAPDAHELMCIMQASAAQIEEEDPQPTYIHTRVPGSRESPNTSATENCISVFVKIARNPAHGLSKKTTMKQSASTHTSSSSFKREQDPRVTAPESPVKIVRAFVCADDWHPGGRRRRAPLPGHVHSLMNMQDSPAHGVVGQLMQDPEVHARVQRAVKALGSSA
ncbi:hypothetical protein PTSG_08723 [Salpingoeca rosetta]|uniref:Uncharacterized protein n=1 Tax=Salpingoeca rosetta (strain ATCC 50818 / BSB-021) TaxID=946362 RepID=F2UKI0_SALR5|nr:uncharacterized protein PTSG_08723 [Salpingoeca rosetta]EGD77629.1 hypothetical protein PTSG_08723 [Salpingoeca rosetta]|eukprot:XP_004990517.1 hypothetical protein PTSG_08723 [Salpingoeca rosetta]